MEHVCTALWCAADKFRRVNFDEVLWKQELAEELAHTWLQSEDGLVRRNTQIDDPVVETDVLSHDCHLVASIFSFFSIAVTIFSGLVGDFSRSILKLEGKDWHWSVDAPKFDNLKLNLLRAAINVSLWFGHLCNYLDDGLFRDLRSKCHHTFANFFAHEEDTLHRGISFTDNHKTHVAFSTWVADSTADSNLLANVSFLDILHSNVNLGEAVLRVTLWADHFVVPEFVSAGVIWILNKISFFCGLLSLTLSQSFSLLGITGSFLVLSSLLLGLLISLLVSKSFLSFLWRHFSVNFLFCHLIFDRKIACCCR